MNFDLLEEVIQYLPLKDIVQNVSISNKILSDASHYVRLNEIYDLSLIENLYEVQNITNNWHHLKFKYKRHCDRKINDVTKSLYCFSSILISTVLITWIIK